MKEIMDQYRDLETNLTRVQDQLQELQCQHDSLMSDLEKTHEREKAFFEDVRSRFGEGKLDLYTFEYVKEEKQLT